MYDYTCVLPNGSPAFPTPDDHGDSLRAAVETLEPVLVEEGEFYRAEVIGTIWMPAVTAAYTYHFQASRTGEAESYVNSESGDFQYLKDFCLWKRTTCASCGGCLWELVKYWDTEDNDLTWVDCMYGHEYQE